jgi:hypothetical protein
MLPSPVPVHNYDQPFEVVGEPYDYGTDFAFVSIDPDRRVELAEMPGTTPPPDQGKAAAAPGAAD